MKPIPGSAKRKIETRRLRRNYLNGTLENIALASGGVPVQSYFWNCMMLKSLSLFPVVFLMLQGGAADASTLPPVDFHQGQARFALGLLDASIDYAFGNRLSMGVTMVPGPWPGLKEALLSPTVAALRVTYRGLELGGTSWGLTLSGGAYSQIPPGPSSLWPSPFAGTPFFSYGSSVFIQPALNATVPLWQGSGAWMVRATLGPIIVQDGPTWRLERSLWANLEIAVPLGEDAELTLLGNSLIGWRKIF